MANNGNINEFKGVYYNNGIDQQFRKKRMKEKSVISDDSLSKILEDENYH